MIRFTIRDLLWLSVVVGVAASWYGDRARLYADKVAAQREARDFWLSTISPERKRELQRKYASQPLELPR